MITGEIVDGRVMIPVNFFLTGETYLSINCVVDTGFNDYLTLPPQAVAFLGAGASLNGRQRKSTRGT